MKDVADKIVEIARGTGLQLVTNRITWDGGEVQTAIGIPTRKQAKRKIWRGIFWVRWKSDALNFWLPRNAELSALSDQYKLEIQPAPVTHKTGGKSHSILAMIRLSKLNLDDPRHKEFIETIIDMNR